TETVWPSAARRRARVPPMLPAPMIPIFICVPRSSELQVPAHREHGRHVRGRAQLYYVLLCSIARAPRRPVQGRAMGTPVAATLRRAFGSSGTSEGIVRDEMKPV